MIPWTPRLFLAATLLASSCSSCFNVSDTKVANLLRARYNKEFTVVSSRHSFETGLSHIKAYCNEIPTLQFSVEYSPETGTINSSFENHLWERQAHGYFEKALNKRYSRFVFDTQVTVRSKIDPKKIPTFESLLGKEPGNLSTLITLYQFKDLNEESKTELLQGIVQITNQLIDAKVRHASVSLRFYDEKSFADKDLKKFKFGFNVLCPECFEVLHQDRYRHKIKFRVYQDSKKVSVDRLFAIRSTKTRLIETFTPLR